MHEQASQRSGQQQEQNDGTSHAQGSK